ncbi:hypothetical protein BV898_08107 [Hypsibius exemplaris]|uniref:Uncharacterized protein n=1 Tax=Hypsibius exemplaris TaxID=2072580 RepID=A0A1W0WRH5_HYPEX|nr:hypothetical protein BV898_08107 [Hypsibius exemplaris]
MPMGCWQSARIGKVRIVALETTGCSRQEYRLPGRTVGRSEQQNGWLPITIHRYGVSPRRFIRRTARARGFTTGGGGAALFSSDGGGRDADTIRRAIRVQLRRRSTRDGSRRSRRHFGAHDDSEALAIGCLALMARAWPSGNSRMCNTVKVKCSFRLEREAPRTSSVIPDDEWLCSS